MAEDSRAVENELYAFSQKQLVELAKAFGIPNIDDSTDKPIIVRNLLRGVGYRYTTQVTKITVTPQQPRKPTAPSRPPTRQLYDLLRTYVADEVMLLNAVASMLETLMQNADMNLDKDDDDKVASYATDLAHELEYFQRHSNHKHFVSILRMIKPPSKLE
jgi:hypothetical protein